MAFKKRIFAKVDCPRCNAEAELRPENEEKSNLFMLYLICPKCKLRKYIGLSSYQIWKLKMTVAKLKIALEKTEDLDVKAALNAKINKLENEINKRELGI